MYIYTIKNDGTIDWEKLKIEESKYILQNNEIDIQIPPGLINPKWDGVKWIDTGKPIVAGSSLKGLMQSEAVSETEILLAEYIIENEERLIKIEEKLGVV